MVHDDVFPGQVAVDNVHDGNKVDMEIVQVPFLARLYSEGDDEPPPQAPADEGQTNDDRGGDGTEDLPDEECNHGRLGGHDEVPQDIEDGDPVHAHSSDDHVQAPHDEGGGDSRTEEANHDVVSANGHEE